MIPIRRIGIQCPHCGSRNTSECYYGNKVTNGLFCYSCGKESFDGTESIKVIRKIKKGGEK